MAGVEKVKVAVKPLSERAKVIEELGRLWDEGLASGRSVDGEEALARVLRRLAARGA